MPEKQKPKVEFSKNGGLVGSVCVSLAGHDAASVLIVVGEGDGCVLVADGKRRLIKAPKAKNKSKSKDLDYFYCGSRI